MLVTVCVVSLALLGWVYWRWSKVRAFWAERNVPHLPPHPVFGSLCFQNNTGIWLKAIYSRFPGPYAGVWLFWRPALVVQSPDLARRILEDSDVFVDRFLSAGRRDTIGRLNLFTVKNPLWKTLRKNLTPVFSLPNLKSFQALLHHKSKQLSQRIRTDTNERKIINLRMMFSDFTTDVIGIASFDVDSDATVSGESQLRSVTKDLMTYSIWRGMAWSSIFFFPKMSDIFGFTMFPKKTTDFFRKVYQTIAKRRRAEGSNRSDVMNAVLAMQQENTNEDITDDTMIAQAAFFLQIGFDTLAVILTFATYELAYHPEAQDHLYDEIRELRQRLGDREFQSEDLLNLTYLSCVINETLRKYPPMSFLERVAARDYKIDAKLTIPAGTPVYVNAIGMHYDAKYFPDPDKFNPDRFLPGNKKYMEPTRFMPFGQGHRCCIGQNLAQLILRHALASILLQFSVRPLPGTRKPSACALERAGILTAPAGMMPVDFVPRGQHSSTIEKDTKLMWSRASEYTPLSSQTLHTTEMSNL